MEGCLCLKITDNNERLRGCLDIRQLNICVSCIWDMLWEITKKSIKAKIFNVMPRIAICL